MSCGINMKVKDLIEHLSEYDTETPVAYHLWLPEDILEQAEDMDITLDEEQIAEVLALINGTSADSDIVMCSIQSVAE